MFTNLDVQTIMEVIRAHPLYSDATMALIDLSRDKAQEEMDEEEAEEERQLELTRAQKGELSRSL